MANTDTFWAFFDKHATQIVLGVAAIILYKTVKNSEPDKNKLQDEADAYAQRDVNSRLVPPPAPVADEEGKIDPLIERDYYIQLKAHRSAQYATQLYDAMHTKLGAFDFHDFDGTDSAKILKLAYSISLARVGLPQLEKDYLALQDKFVLSGSRIALLDDLRSELSSADYLTFMSRIGLTPDQTQQELHPTKKAPVKK